MAIVWHQLENSMRTEIRITDPDFVRRICDEQERTGERSPVKTVVRLVTERFALREVTRPDLRVAGNQPIGENDVRRAS